MQKHVLLTFVGLILAIALVAWLRPATAGGVTLVGATAMLFTISVGSLFIRNRPKVTQRREQDTR